LAANPPSADWSAKANEWEAVHEVLLTGGTTVPVSTHEIVEMFRATPPDPQRLQDYLAALLNARQHWSSAGDGAPQLAALEAILARPEFQDAPENPLNLLYRRILDFFLKLFEKLFPHSGRVSLPFPPWLVIGLSVLILGGILAFIFRDVWRNLLHEAELGDENPADSEILSSSQASRRAQHLSTSGEYRQAVRYLYLSALLLLDERGLLRYNRTQTNREYLRQVSNQPGLASQLYPVIDTFDRVWYGFQTIDEDSYTRYAGQVSALAKTEDTGEAGK
jgi:hypothetical protein